MDIKQLKTFMCIAQTGSLSAASDRLRLAQPALSRQMKLLEHEIGVPLFSRHARGMSLTEAGKQFLDKISGLIAQLEQSVDDIRSSNGDIKGRVNIGVLPTSNMALILRIVHRVQQQHPHIDLHLVEGYSGYLVEWLQRGDLDISLLNGPMVDFHLPCTPLLYEDIALISAANSLPYLGDKIRFTDIKDIPLAVPNRPHGLRMLVDKCAEKTGVSLNFAIRVNAFAILKKLVTSGNYHAFVPLSSVSEDIQAGTLEARTFVSPPLRRQLIVAMPPHKITSRATETVLNILYDETVKMIEQRVWQAFLDMNFKKKYV